MLNRLIFQHLFAAIKNLHIAKLFVGYPEYAYFAERRHPAFHSCNMNIRIFGAGAVPQIDTELKHCKPIRQEFLTELGIFLPVFLGICWKVKQNQHPHNPIFAKSCVHFLALRARLTKFWATKLLKNVEFSKLFVKLFAYFRKKTYLCITFLE